MAANRQERKQARKARKKASKQESKQAIMQARKQAIEVTWVNPKLHWGVHPKLGSRCWGPGLGPLRAQGPTLKEVHLGELQIVFAETMMPSAGRLRRPAVGVVLANTVTPGVGRLRRPAVSVGNLHKFNSLQPRCATDTIFSVSVPIFFQRFFGAPSGPHYFFRVSFRS